MRLVVQRVSSASVREGDRLLGEIGTGALVLVGIATQDDDAVVDGMADKLVGLRYFRDADGRTNLAIGDVGGAFLVVSQFTLQADVSRGRRPGFTGAAPPSGPCHSSIGSSRGSEPPACRSRPDVSERKWRSSS